jgi:hypothetical protein
VWHTWYRDYLAQKPAVSRAEIAEIDAPEPGSRHALPWRIALQSKNLWYIVAMYFATQQVIPEGVARDGQNRFA